MKIRDIEVFQVSWAAEDRPEQRSAWVRIHGDDGFSGVGEASPMQGGLASLGIIERNLAPALIGEDPLDHTVLLDTLLHTFAKLGPEGALTGALAALDIALWDLKGKLFDQPIYKLIGGAWQGSHRSGLGLLHLGRRLRGDEQSCRPERRKGPGLH